MSSGRAYRPRRRTGLSSTARAKILTAVRELLAEGTFHEATVEEVAARAGVARATLYQHFGSRLGLVDAMCDTFDENPSLLALRCSVELDDDEEALAQTLANVVGFWASEEPILLPLYGVAAVDPAARDLVRRQRADRRGEMKRLVARLPLRPGLTEKAALAHLLVLTSFETFEELRRHAGLPQREVTKYLQATARSLLLR